MGGLAVTTLLVGSLVLLTPARADAKPRDCTPGPSLNLAGCDYANADVSFVNFSDSNLTGANLSGANLNGTNFTGADLKRADLAGAGIVLDCETAGCPAMTIGFLQIEFDTSPNFTNADLHDVDLSAARLGTYFTDEGELCVPHFPCIQTFHEYPGAIFDGVKSGGITGTPASLPASTLLIDGFLTPFIAAPLIATTTLPSGNINRTYSASFVATGGNPPYKWSVIGGTLPPGLHLRRSSGIVGGKPQASGTYSFTVGVTDSKTALPPHWVRMANQPFSITIH